MFRIHPCPECGAKVENAGPKLLVSIESDLGPFTQRAQCGSCGQALIRYPASDDPTWQVRESGEGLEGDEALELANDELHQMRRERGKKS
jgi:hypothetical protein